MSTSLAILQHDVQSSDWNTALAASDALVQHGTAALPVLLPLLSSTSSQVRSAAALALREIADNAAVKPIIHAIQDPTNVDDRGTLLYALETHDCSSYFLLLFELALDDAYEVQNHALSILHKQQFVCLPADLAAAAARLEVYALQHVQSPNVDILVEELTLLLESSE